MAEFAVIGLGRFGRSVARNLARAGEQVLAVDLDRARLQKVESEVEAVAVVDTTQEEAVAALRLERMACVVVTIGARSTEASLLTTTILRDRGVARIVARAFDDRHARLLLAIGASEVLNPEDRMGRELAQRLAVPSIVGEIDLGDRRVAAIEAPETLVGRRLDRLAADESLDLKVLDLHREGRAAGAPAPGERVESGDVLIVSGTRRAIRRLAVLI